MEEIRLQSMHQLDEKMEEIQGFRILEQKPPTLKTPIQSVQMQECNPIHPKMWS
jgi:hypothetical protein